MCVADSHLVILNDPIEAFLRRITQKFLGHRDVFLGGETETVNDFLNLVLCGLNLLGNLDFLVTGEELNLPHLLEVHPHGIVQRLAGIV